MRYWLLVMTACALPISAVPAHAQRTISIAVAGGASLPVGDFASSVDAGWHAAAGLVISSLAQPISLRADVTRHQLAFEDDAPGHQAITSGTLSLMYRLPSAGWPVAPYNAVGAGAYHLTCGGDAECGSATRFGWSGGGGIRTVIMGLHTFIEVRYHSVVRAGSNAAFLPITLGLTL